MNDDDQSREDGELSEVSPEELAQATRLREALEGTAGTVGEAGAADDPELLLLARALPHVFAPRDLEAADHAELVTAALAKAKAKAPATTRRKPRRVWLGASLGAGATLALAASVLLVFGRSESADSASAPASSPVMVATVAGAVMVPRSTEPLFVRDARPLGRHGNASGTIAGSARIDRIASARSGEYLQARLTRWGAR